MANHFKFHILHSALNNYKYMTTYWSIHTRQLRAQYKHTWTMWEGHWCF